jgi:hypothetical protein
MSEAQRPCGEERAAAATERVHAEEELRSAALAVSSAKSEAVFPELVRYLATLLNVEMAFIALPHADDPRKLQMLAFWLDGQIRENFAYLMAGTPRRPCCPRLQALSARPCRLFPLDSTSPRWAWRASRVSCPATGGADSGLMSVVSRRPLTDARVQSILQIFAVRRRRA